MLFSLFPTVEYKNTPTTDIYRDYRTYFKRVLKNYKPRSYQITGAFRPEQLAYLLYNNQQLYWVLTMLNNVYDPFYDWITTQETAYNAVTQKYSKVGGNHVVYHIDKNNEKYYDLIEYPERSGKWYHKNDKDHEYLQYDGVLVPIDTYEDSLIINEGKREILIISPSDINSFVSDLIKEMEKSK